MSLKENGYGGGDRPEGKRFKKKERIRQVRRNGKKRKQKDIEED